MSKLSFYILLLIGFCAITSSCYKLRGHYGGTKNFDPVTRNIAINDVALPDGYKIEPLVSGLTFPTGIAFDEDGNVYAIEAGYSYGEVWTTPRLIKVESDGQITEIAKGDKNGPWTGVDYRDGMFYVSEGGQLEGGKILKITKDGKITILVDSLPSVGDHHTNVPVVGNDGYVYFGQGVATNSGVVGKDNIEFGWLKRYPEFHDIPCNDITLTGQNFKTDNYLTYEKNDKVKTGAYSSFGTTTSANQIIKGSIPCSGAIMRVPINGGKPEVVAWGLRNPYGISFSPDGRLYVSENSYDTRGSRPVYGTGDILWEIKPGTWYGWPDYAGGKPLADKDYKTNKDDPEFLLAVHPNIPPAPTAILGVHSSSSGFDFSKSESFGYVGEAFIAQFGDMAPDAGRIYGPVGFKVVRVNVSTGVINEFLVNKGKINAPASRIETGGIERPITVRFDPTGTMLYVVDFGVMPITEDGPAPKKQTGVIWKVTRSEITKAEKK